MRLVFLGAPGAGKGTQATKLARKLGIPHISSGDLLREAAKENSPLARELKKYLDTGQLIPDEMMNKDIRTRLSNLDASKGFILDGYPRTVAQARALQEELNGKNLELNGVVFFNLPKEKAVERLSGRRACKNCSYSYHLKYKPPDKEGVCDNCGGMLYRRDDDNPEIIRKRFVEFEKKTADLIAFYRDKNLLIEIDASSESKEIYAKMLESLGLTD